MVADPLHRLDCCVVTDGGGALVVVHPDVARALGRAGATVLGHGEALKHADAGRIDLTYSAARWSGPAAFTEAGVAPGDIQYASIYDSFTITVLIALEDLGFCDKGRGGAFVADGALRSPDGRLPFNTDGGGLCNNHPGNRGGMTKVIEAVRQLRGEAHPAVQVPGCELALAHGTGGALVDPARERHARVGCVGVVSQLPAFAPPYSPEAEPYWSAAAQGRLVLPVCDACGHHIWYPRSWCPVCGSESVTWTELSGRGTVYACTTLRKAAGPWQDAVPYVVAYVELAEGPRLLTNVVTDDPASVRIDAAVTATFVPVAAPADGDGARAILRFTLDR